MIALGETDETAAEIPFKLPTGADPVGTGFTGYGFPETFVGSGVTDQVQYLLPGSLVWKDATIAKIFEIGFGRYVYRLIASECTTAGVVKLRAYVPGNDVNGVPLAQPDNVQETIGPQGGEIAVGGSDYFMFFLPNGSDPVYGSPISVHTFVTGEAKLRLPSGVYANADVTQVQNFGNGWWGLLMRTGIETISRGKAFLYVNVAGSQPFEGYITILSPTAGSSDSVPPTIQIVDPPAGTTIQPGQPITFRFFDNVAIRRALPMIRFTGPSGTFDDGHYELIHDGDDFTPDYNGTRTAYPGGWQFTVTRKGGWGAVIEHKGGSPTFVPFGTDTSGNEPS